jgi:hypothetical protein
VVSVAGSDEASGRVAGDVSVSVVGATVVVSSVDEEDDSWWDGGWRSITVEDVFACLESTAKLREDSINTMAAPTVTLLRKVPGPRLPKTV